MCDDTANFVLSGTTCICSSASYASGTSCLSCDYSCLTCAGAGGNSCSSCDTNLGRIVSGTSCPCNSAVGFADAGVATCACPTGFIQSGVVCVEICGDGVLYVLACDDGNTVDGDGCSSTCTIEAGWTCSGTPSVCGPASLSLNLISIIKSPDSNNILLAFNVTPFSNSYSIAEFATVITTNASDITLSFAY